VAGLGSAGDSGDNGPATASQLYRPSGIAVDGNGNLFVADRQRIRKINVASGMITGVAGTGESGYSGDKGPAGQAQMHGVWAIAADRLGSVFVAEKGNNVIRKVSPDGMIATVAGNGVEGYAGDGGPAVQARLNAPQGVAVDAAGNLFIADAGNNRIRRVARDGTITTIAGTGDAGFAGDGGAAAQARLNGPRGLALDPSGALVIADYGNHRIRKMSAGNLVISTIAGNGKEGFSGDGRFAVDAQLNFPSGVATDGAGNVFVADTSNNRIRKISTNGTITTVAGNGSRGFSGDMGPATAAGLNLPVNVAVDGKGDIYVADTTNRRIRHVAGSTQAPASHQPPGLPGQP
jgi:sugar lactone lactonase YvrE